LYKETFLTKSSSVVYHVPMNLKLLPEARVTPVNISTRHRYKQT